MEGKAAEVLPGIANPLDPVMGFVAGTMPSSKFSAWLVSERILNRADEPLLTPKTRVMSPCIVQNSL